MVGPDLEKLFPGLVGKSCEIKSQKDGSVVLIMKRTLPGITLT